MRTKSTNYGEHRHNNYKSKKDSRFDWRTIFLRNSGGISSKRVLAMLGVFTCLGILIAAYILEKDIPEFANIVFIGSLSLYGIEVIPTGLWSKTITKEQ